MVSAINMRYSNEKSYSKLQRLAMLECKPINKITEQLNRNERESERDD